MAQRATPATPRGRHAPPLEVRKDRQRRRLFAAAATVFARSGFADATAEGIAREAGMSKATFYEHFDNKEDCIVALFDAAVGALVEGMRAAGDVHAHSTLTERIHATTHALLATLAEHPDEAQTLLVEIVGAGPRALARRDAALDAVARYIDEMNVEDVARGAAPRFGSPLDAYAVVGAFVELASRQLRTGRPADIRELEPVVERLVLGLIGTGDPA
jgi:AcrR family transcriptional regulator